MAATKPTTTPAEKETNKPAKTEQPKETSQTKNNATEGKTVSCLHIKSRSEQGFRRCGFGFTPAGGYFPKSLFSEADIQRLKADMHLLVTEVEVDESEI